MFESVSSQHQDLRRFKMSIQNLIHPGSSAISGSHVAIVAPTVIIQGNARGGIRKVVCFCLDKADLTMSLEKSSCLTTAGPFAHMTNV